MYVRASIDVGFLKAYLPINFVPSTSTNYLGSRFRVRYGTWERACFNGRHPYHFLRKFINISWQNNFTIHSTSTNPFMAGRMYLVPWFPLASKVGYLALVNDPPYWSIIQWVLLLLASMPFIHIWKIAQWIVADEDRVLWDLNKFTTICFFIVAFPFLVVVILFQ